ncbi:histidine phosphatase family protein [Planktotalea sp.]|uniref:histidine phosphatase family protein n=1 Tax=Planktotalea sp. TaxID=2029877 RepID=UPI003299A627
MQRLFLVRHGPTHAKGMIGWTDLPADLSDTAALSRLSAYLPSDARVVSSDLVRAVDTADAIQGGRARSPHNPALREMHFGRWENLTFKNLPPEDAALAKAFYEKPGDLAPPDGESWNAVCARVSDAVDQALSASTQDLIVVCHFGVILTQLQRATGKSAYDTFAQKIDNLSATEVIIENGKWRAGAINHCP